MLIRLPLLLLLLFVLLCLLSVEICFTTEIFNGLSNTYCLDKQDRVRWHRNVFENIQPLSIEISVRPTHKLMSYVLALLLRDRLGYSQLSFHQHKWNNLADVINRMTHPIVSAEISEAVPDSHVNLEVWMPPGFTSRKWVDNKLIIDCGPTGPRARTGIFHSNGLIETITWQDLMYNSFNKTKADESTRQISKKYRDHLRSILVECDNKWCQSSFVMDKELPAEFSRFLNHKFTNWTIDLNQLVHDKSLFYLSWYPNIMTVKEQLNRILLPDCNFNNDNLDAICDHPVHQMTKLIWTGVKNRAPLIYDLVDSFKITHEELTNMLLKLNSSDASNDQYQSIACDWIRNNPNKWKVWTLGWNLTKYFDIIVLLSRYDDYPITIKEKEVLNNAIKQLNEDAKFFGSSLQYQYRVKYIYMDCQHYEMMREYLSAVNIHEDDENAASIVGILSGLPTSCLNSVYKLAHAQKLVTISYKHQILPILLQYEPSTTYIYQINPTLDSYLYCLVRIMKYFEWTRSFILTDNPVFDTNLYRDQTFHIHEIEDMNDHQIRQLLIQLKNKDQARIIITIFLNRETLFSVLCAAGHLKMNIEAGFVWILQWPMGFDNEESSESSMYQFCKNQIREVTRHHLLLTMHHNHKQLLKYQNPHPTNIHSATIILGSYAAEIIKESSMFSSRFNSSLLNNRLSQTENSYSAWNTWYLMQEENRHYHKCVELHLKPKYSLSDEFSSILKKGSRNVYWGRNSHPPKDGSFVSSSRYCWAGIIVSTFNINCSTAEIVVVLFLAGFILCFVVGTLLTIFMIKMRNRIDTDEDNFMNILNSLSDVIIPSNRLYINHVIGQGAFGMVYGGECRDQRSALRAVAVKSVGENANYRARIDLLSEAKTMYLLNPHANIVQLIGVCLENERNMIFVVMELMVEGDLRNYLLSHRGEAASGLKTHEVCSNLTNFACDIAHGLEHMHSQNWIHRDVACRNCLLSHDLRVKLADFGLTIRDESNENSTLNLFKDKHRSMTLPIRWMPPEALQHGLFSSKSDIWSFGILLFELVTFGMCPYQDYSSERQGELMDKIKNNNISIVQYLPSSSCNSLVLKLIQSCCEHEAAKRPESMEDIAASLHASHIQPYLTDEPPQGLTSSLPWRSNMPAAENNPLPWRKSVARTPVHLSNKLRRAYFSSHNITNSLICSQEILADQRNKKYIGSIPFDLCSIKKCRNISLNNLFRISPKISIHKLKY